MRYYTGTPYEIVEQVIARRPEWNDVLTSVRAKVPSIKREIYAYQAAVLYDNVREYADRENVRILEIGTALGFSAAVMASAAPKSQIVTLNPKDNEVPEARKNLASWPNVTVVQMLSWDYLAQYKGEQFDVVFVDGDHKNIRLDLPWFEHVKIGGLFIHHDYSPEWSTRPCRPVYEALNAFGEKVLHRDFDVLAVDNNDVGVAGWVKIENDLRHGPPYGLPE